MSGEKIMSETFVEGIPAEVFDEGVYVHHADGHFSPKLGLRLGLASYYRTHMGLRDADYAIIDPLCLCLVHLSLLSVEHANGFQFSGLSRALRLLWTSRFRRKSIVLDPKKNRFIQPRFLEGTMRIWVWLLHSTDVVSKKLLRVWLG